VRAGEARHHPDRGPGRDGAVRPGRRGRRRRERAAATCGDCAVHPAELRPGHEADLNRADEYDALSARRYTALDTQPAGPGPVTEDAMRAAIAATHAGGGSDLRNLAAAGPDAPAREARKHIIRAALAAGAAHAAGGWLLVCGQPPGHRWPREGLAACWPSGQVRERRCW
jgi:hypothetical protein